MRKWLNLPTKESDYSADTDSGSDADLSDDGQLLISLFLSFPHFNFYSFFLRDFISFLQGFCFFGFFSSSFNSKGGV